MSNDEGVVTNADGAEERCRELRHLDEQIAARHAEARQLRTGLGDDSQGAIEPEERAAVIQSAEEHEAIAASLEASREELRRRLDEERAT